MTIQRPGVEKSLRTSNERNPSEGKGGVGASLHAQIAAGARAAWLSKGRPPDQDRKNWRASETALRKPIKARP
jgi:hypothetical protein